MPGILANSPSKTMLAGDTAADNATSGFVTLEDITLSVSPTGAAYAWGLTKPSASTNRSELSSTTDASPTFTPDVGGYYTITCVVDAITTYVIRIAVAAIGTVSTISALRCLPLSDSAVPAPPTGVTVYFSADGDALSEKDPSNFVRPLGVAYMFDATYHGAVGDTIQTTATIAALSNVATIAGLTSADVGKIASIEGAGAGADLIAAITNVDGSNVTLATAATDGAAGAITFIGTSDATALDAADAAATSNGTLLLPPGKYLVDSSRTISAGTLVVMRGATFVILHGSTLTVSGYIQAAPDQLPGIADVNGNGSFAHTYTAGFFGVTPGVKPTITGDASDPALVDLLSKLDTLGLLTDSST